MNTEAPAAAEPLLEGPGRPGGGTHRSGTRAAPRPGMATIARPNGGGTTASASASAALPPRGTGSGTGSDTQSGRGYSAPWRHGVAPAGGPP